MKEKCKTCGTEITYDFEDIFVNTETGDRSVYCTECDTKNIIKK